MLVLHCIIFVNSIKHMLISYEQVQKQVELIKANEEEHGNLADPLYSTNSDEGDIVRRILTSYIRTCLPDHLTQ